MLVTSPETIDYVGNITTPDSSVFSNVYVLKDGRAAFAFRTGAVWAYEVDEEVIQDLGDPSISAGHLYSTRVKGTRGEYLGTLDELDFRIVSAQDQQEVAQTDIDYGYAPEEDTSGEVTEVEAFEASVTIQVVQRYSIPLSEATQIAESILGLDSVVSVEIIK